MYIYHRTQFVAPDLSLSTIRKNISYPTAMHKYMPIWCNLTNALFFFFPPCYGRTAWYSWTGISWFPHTYGIPPLLQGTETEHAKIVHGQNSFIFLSLFFFLTTRLPMNWDIRAKQGDCLEKQINAYCYLLLWRCGRYDRERYCVKICVWRPNRL